MAEGDDGRPSARMALAELAEHYYEACLLWEHEDLDPADHVEVVRRAFLNSDCGSFARVLSDMTGWPILNLSSPGEGPVHSLVEAPGGRWLDASGWTTRAAVARRYAEPRLEAAPAGTGFVVGMREDLGELCDEGFSEEAARVVSAVRALPGAPFQDAWFREISSRPYPGVDVPSPVPPAVSPGP